VVEVLEHLSPSARPRVQSLLVPQKKKKKRFIIRNWFTQLWTWTNPKICRVSGQGGNQEEYIFQIE
jgi:hypothetical protein